MADDEGTTIGTTAKDDLFAACKLADGYDPSQMHMWGDVLDAIQAAIAKAIISKANAALYPDDPAMQMEDDDDPEALDQFDGSPADTQGGSQ